VEIEATLAREEEALAAAADACHGAEQARDAALDAAEESRAVERVFSMTGVRAQLLSGALQGIESIADAWLARLAPQARPMHLRLKSYTEKASGAVSDAISLDVEGAGGGHGYRGASGGERQRINVALCLALGEVASAAYGIAPGTLFLDEVFDALDADGVAAVRDALEDMARDRAVLVITHAPALVESLAAAEVWHVDRGVVTVTRSAP
jgi:DNA repair exonuclease SbcCD ATPase subunit